MKRRRGCATPTIQGIPRNAIFKEILELSYPRDVGMEVDDEEEEGAVEDDRIARERELESEKYNKVNEMVDCLDHVLKTLEEKNVHLFARIVSRCGVDRCRSFLKQCIVSCIIIN